MSDVTPVVVGDVVRISDESYVEHDALVTAVHGQFGEHVPCINVVYVGKDPAKRDPYGHQLERLSSLQHKSATVSMPRPGRFWVNK